MRRIVVGALLASVLVGCSAQVTGQPSAADPGPAAPTTAPLSAQPTAPATAPATGSTSVRGVDPCALLTTDQLAAAGAVAEGAAPVGAGGAQSFSAAGGEVAGLSLPALFLTVAPGTVDRLDQLPRATATDTEVAGLPGIKAESGETCVVAVQITPAEVLRCR